MHSTPSRGPFRWRRLVAACGVATSLVALGTIGFDGQLSLASLWLLFAGVALAVLSVHAIRKERATLSALDAIEGERHRADERRRAAEARSFELAETSPDVVTVLGPDGTITYVSPACREVL